MMAWCGEQAAEPGQQGGAEHMVTDEPGPAGGDGARTQQDGSTPGSTPGNTGADAEVPSVEAVVPSMSGDANHAVVPGKPDAGAGSKRRCL